MGANSQKLTRNEIINFFKSEGRVRFDELINKKANFEEDFNDRAFKRFLQKAKITPTIDKDKLLINLDCCDDTGRLTNAGVMFFARNIEFLIPYGVVTCALYKGTEKVFILDKKDFDDNILENIDNAVSFVQRHINLEFKIEHIQREEIPEIPEVALREAIVNAVCHRDYFEKGANVMVEVYDDRVEITNPGGLPSGLSIKDFGTKSVLRNSIIASLLSRVDYIEKMGTGINRIKNSIIEHGLGTVKFDIGSFFVTTFSREKSSGKSSGKEITGKEITGKSSEKSSGKEFTGKEFTGKEITGKEITGKEIYRLISEDSNITISSLAKQLNKSISSVEKHLAVLKKTGKIIRVGGRKSGYWKCI